MKPSMIVTVLLGAYVGLAASTAFGQVRFDEDHLKCYKVVRDELPHGTRNVELSNHQFGDELCKVQKRASYLCAPTVKWKVDGQIVPNDPRGDALGSDFLCYKLKCANDQKREITINDQFGERRILTTRAQLLCTPARKVDWPNVPCAAASAPACAGECPQQPGLPPLVCAPAGGGGACTCVPQP
jgi:hypothetical protein